MEKADNLRSAYLASLLDDADTSIQTKGYTLVRNVLKQGDIARCLVEYERFVCGVYADGSFGIAKDDFDQPLVINRVDKVSDILFDLARRPDIKQLAERMVGGPVVPLHVEFFSKPAKTTHFSPPHQDQIFYQPHFDDEIAITVWIALSKITSESAPLQYFRCNKLELLDHKGADTLDFDFELEKSPTETPETIVMNVGDAAIHHAFTIHRSLPNISNSPRIAIAFNYRTSELGRRARKSSLR